MINNNICNCLQIVPFHYCPGRVIREVQDQDFALFGDLFHQRIRHEPELVFLKTRYRDWYATSQSHTRCIGDVNWFRNEGFITRVNYGPYCNIQRF